MSNWERLKRVVRVFFFMAVILGLIATVFAAAVGAAAIVQLAVSAAVGHPVGTFWMYAAPACALACFGTVWLDFRMN